MANPRPGNQNGVPNGPNTPAAPSQQQPSFSRPFTLYEALPYSPFTSIVPFDADIIPTPTLGSASTASSLSGLASRQDFDTLNNEAANPAQASRRVEQSLEHVQQLLSPSRITKYNFRKGPQTRAVTPGRPAPNFTANLSSFTKMVYDKTSVAYSYPSPDSPGATSPNGQAASPSLAKLKSPKSRKTHSPKVAANIAANTQAHAHNAAKFEIILPTKRQLEAATAVPPQPQTIDPAELIQPPPLLQPVQQQGLDVPVTVTPSELQLPPAPKPPVTGGFTIDLAQPATFNKDEYMVVPDVMDEPVNLSSRKRKRDGSDDSQDVYGAALDQRQRADAAYDDVRRCFQEIFQAEDFLQTTGPNQFVSLTNDQDATLTGASHSKVQTLLQKAISLGCFKHIPLDDLLRIQRLSEGALKQADTGDLKLEESSSESDIQIWLQQLPDVETGLKAARTSLTLMAGGREDKQLYSEDTTQYCLNLFKNVMDALVVPIAELRNSGATQNLFRLLQPHKKPLAMIFTYCLRLFSTLASLVATVDLQDTVVNTLEFAASKLIFVDSGHTDRESVVGVQKFDGIRLVAMDMLSQIFLRNPAQRQGIFDDILTSLEKLPVGKQSARQFKLLDGRSIQPVSALIMRLVQSSAGKVDEKITGQSKLIQSMEEDDNADGDDVLNGGATGALRSSFTINSEERASDSHSTAIQELQDVSSPLTETSKRNASYVINFIVNRALKSTKSGDTPYRNLLDLFVEDFTTCLDSPDWPSAELLLRLLMYMMIKLFEGDKSSAPAKNMALELLGVMGAAISRLRSQVRKSANALDAMEPSELGLLLSDLASAALEQRSRPELVLSWSGPYRATLEHLQERCADDPHLRSAISFLISEWASKVTAAYDAYEDEDDGRDQELGRLAYRLRRMIEDRRWLSREYNFIAVSTMQAKLAYAITIVRSAFCESYAKILNLLLRSMTIDQATVRSKSLKSINQVLETDPSILDGDSTVIQLILQCSNDSSPQVRDSALGLIGKCIGMRPSLEETMIPTVIQRFIDSGVGVRKRAMKLAKDIYLRNNSKADRSTIANGLLHRVQDPDEGVREIARQLIADIWIAPFSNVEDTAAFQTSLREHVALIVQTVKSGNVTPVLDKVFQNILGTEAKATDATFKVCQMLVANMFDLIDNPDSDDPSTPSGRDALQVLMVFAKADARLFTFEQIRLLKPQISNVGSSEDLAVSRAVVEIYRRVLPHLSSVHKEFLADVRKDLMPTVSKITRALLDDVIACLWIISGLLDTSEHLARLVLSSLMGVQKIRAMSQREPLDDRKIRQFDRYSLIVGMAGKHCDLDSHENLFKTGFPKWQGGSISKLMVDVLIPFASPSQALDVRKAALDAVGLICQSWPRNFGAANVYTSFQQVFDEQNPLLEGMILRSFKEFLINEERRSEQAAAAAAGNQNGENKQKLTVMGGTNFDDVASATTQRFMKDITRIALATQDEHAFLAVEVLASINRQGLVHPKETGVTLITLETSSVHKISELAYHEHRSLHDKHETVVEREYVRAIQSAFAYQRDIAKDPHGATTDPFTSKLSLMMEVLKMSKSKNRSKFLEKFVSQVDFEPAKIDASESMPPHVQYSRFIIENLAFFDYMTVGELQTTVATMEKLVSSTGSSVAQAIESELFQVRMDVDAELQQSIDGQEGTMQPVQPAMDMKRLRQLTAGSMILQSLWEARTYLRRLYGLGTSRRDPKAKGLAKDLSRAPIKVQGITGDKFWEEVGTIMSALSSQEQMLAQCKSFVELLNVDKEFKVADEDDDMDGEDPTTPSNDEDDAGERGRKRKASNTPGGRKKRARSTSQPRKRGRPKKNAMVDIDAEGESDDGDWF